MNGEKYLILVIHLIPKHLVFSLGYQSFMLSLKSQISVLDNFVIREESISPVLAMINKESNENSQNLSDGSNSDVSIFISRFRTISYILI
jgi:hypothetical protein